MKMKEIVLTAGLGTLQFSVTTPSSVTEKGMQFHGTTGFVTVFYQLAQQLTSYQKTELYCWKQFSPLRHCSAFMEVRSSSCSRRHPNFSTATKHYKSYGREVWLRFWSSRRAKICNTQKICFEQGILFVPLAVETLCGLSVTLKKTLKRTALLADSGNYQSQGHDIAIW